MTHSRNIRIFGPVITCSLCLILWGCPDEETTPDAGQSTQTSGFDGGDTQGGNHSDAGVMPQDGGQVDSGAILDAGPVATDGGLDAGPVSDGGFMCPIDNTDPPEPWGDAGPPPCTLRNPQGEGFFRGNWEGRVWGDFPITAPFDLPGEGTMEFHIICSGNKFSITGTITGLANALYPFEGQLSGEFFPTTGEIEILMNPATLSLGIADGHFIAKMNAQRQNDIFPDGVWCGISTIPEGAFGDGTWTASLQ